MAVRHVGCINMVTSAKMTYGEVPVELARPCQQLLEALHKAAPMHGSVHFLGAPDTSGLSEWWQHG